VTETEPRRLVRLADLYNIPSWSLTRLGLQVLPPRVLLYGTYARGLLRFLLDFKHRRSYERDLVEGYPDLSWLDVRRLALMRFLHQESKPLTSVLPRLSRFAPPDIAGVQGSEHLSRAIAEGRGAILLTAHLGFGRVIKPVLIANGFQTRLLGSQRKKARDWSRLGHLMYRKVLRMPYFEDWEDADLAAGLNLRPILAALDCNEFVLTTVDGRRTSRAVTVRLLGQEAPFNGGILSLALERDTLVLPVFAIREHPGSVRLTLFVERPLTAQGDDFESRLTSMAQGFAGILEGYIGRYPYMYGQYNPRRRMRRFVSGMLTEQRA
jgi:lauroyl/myristoyl acyltransferase